MKDRPLTKKKVKKSLKAAAALIASALDFHKIPKTDESLTISIYCQANWSGMVSVFKAEKAFSIAISQPQFHDVTLTYDYNGVFVNAEVSGPEGIELLNIFSEIVETQIDNFR